MIPSCLKMAVPNSTLRLILEGCIGSGCLNLELRHAECIGAIVAFCKDPEKRPAQEVLDLISGLFPVESDGRPVEVARTAILKNFGGKKN